MKKLFFAVFVLTAWHAWAGASGERSQAVQPDFSYSPPETSGGSAQASSSPGDIGMDTRDEIAWRKAWVDRLGECDRYVADYIQKTPLPTLLVYSATAERGAIDWERETTAISFRIALYPDENWPIPLRNMMNETYSAFAATGKAEAWGIKWPTRAVSGEPSPIRAETTCEHLVAVELVNGQGQVIGTQSVSLNAGWKTGFTGPHAPLLDREGLGIDTASHESNATAVSIQTVKTLTFPYVRADKITGSLSIRIVRLNGRSVETAAQIAQVNIMTEAAYGRLFEERLNMIPVRGATYTMGGTDRNEQPQHRETVKPFYLGKYEVTAGEYRAFLIFTGRKPNLYESDDMPAGDVSWFDAIRYCNWLSRMTGRKPVYTIHRDDKYSRREDDVTWDPAANGFRLPTEAEWEYTCRAGTATAYSFGNSVSPGQACYQGRGQRGRNYPVPVGSFAPNPWGFHDMHGNVWEWCWDYRNDHGSLQRALRGGSHLSSEESLRSSYRHWRSPGDGSAGFRVARSSDLFSSPAAY